MMFDFVILNWMSVNVPCTLLLFYPSSDHHPRREVKRHSSTVILREHSDRGISSFLLTSSMLNKGGHVYIMTNKNNNVLYIGVSSALKWRVEEHKSKAYPRSFTAKYNVDKLIYFEFFDSIGAAIDREKYLKRKDFL